MPIILLVLVIMLQIMFVGFAIVSKVVFHDEVYILGIPIYLILVIILDIVSILLLGNIYQKHMEQKIKLTESTHEEQYRILINSVKSEHHDFKNHLTVISGLLAIESYDMVKNYVKDLIGDVHVNSQILNISNPVLASLFISKIDSYKKNNITFQLNIASEKIVYIMSSTDLIRLVSNLLDNAYEATLEMPIDKRFIMLELLAQSDYVELVMKNSSVLTEFDSSFFEIGYSTKLNNDKNRGYGMSIIQKITKKYNAKLDVYFENNQICFKIIFPNNAK